MEAAILGIVQLAQAIGADGDVRRDGLEGLGNGLRVQDLKAREAICRAVGSKEIVNARERRRLVAQGAYEGIQDLLRPIGQDIDTCGGVSHPSQDAKPGGQIVNKGTETDPLNNARDVYAGPTDHFIRRPRLPRRIPHRSRSWPPYFRSSDK